MFTEVRRKGKSKKYYLVHAFRMGGKVHRISRYLGSNLSDKQLSKLRKQAEQHIIEQIRERSVFHAELTDEELVQYTKLDKKINVDYLQTLNWEKFTKTFTYNTNAIEGSTVSLSEVKKLVDKENLPENLDEIETINVAKAIDYVRKSKGVLSPNLIKKIHAICFKETKHFAGKLRDVGVAIRDSQGNIIHQGAPHTQVAELLKELFEWYSNHKRKYPPLLLAAVVHNQFEMIHPFQDGNGRVGRILLNYILLRHQYPPINITLKDRLQYYSCLQIYDKTGDAKPMIRFLIKEYKKQYR